EPQQRVVGEQQHKRTNRAQVHQEFALHHGVFEEVHRWGSGVRVQSSATDIITKPWRNRSTNLTKVIPIWLPENRFFFNGRLSSYRVRGGYNRLSQSSGGVR